MKITPIYNDRPTALVTGQVLDVAMTLEDATVALEASLQFVNGSSAVEFDFSFFGFSDATEKQRAESLQDLNQELLAVRALKDHVDQFAAAFEAAVQDVTDRLQPVPA